MTATIHNFNADLWDSLTPQDEARVLKLMGGVYPEAKELIAATNKNDQALGVDRWLQVDGAMLLLDVKKRYKDYHDVLLEYRSEICQRIPEGVEGWALDLTKQTSWIIYLTPTKELALPYPIIRALTRQHLAAWQRKYPTISAMTKGKCEAYQTKNIAIPTRDLWATIYQQCNPQHQERKSA